MSIHKKAQIFGMPLIMIFALILGALILAWGIKAIFDLQKNAECISHLEDIQSLKTDIKAYYNFEPGSQKFITLKFNSKIKKICFIDPEKEFTEDINNEDLFFFMESSTKDNMFTSPLNFCNNPNNYIPYLKPEKNPLCFNNREQAIITTQTDFVEISEK